MTDDVTHDRSEDRSEDRSGDRSEDRSGDPPPAPSAAEPREVEPPEALATDPDRVPTDVESADPVDVENERLRRLEIEGDVAADYLEELLDIADLDGDLDLDVEGERAAVSVIGADLNQLVGPDGAVLDALQELTRLAVFQSTGERSRLMLDIGGHRARRRHSLEALTVEAVARVRESGQPVTLDPMNPFERKVVHDAVAAAGMLSESEGEAADRRVVISPR